MAFVELIPLAGCREQGGTYVRHDDRELAVFRLVKPDRVIVIDNACPHSSGNLSGGEVTGEIVTCPLHQWEFDLTTGVCIHSDLARVRRYDIEIRDGSIWIDFEVRSDNRQWPAGATRARQDMRHHKR